MKLLVTGASGFIGRHLLQSAVERGHEVVGTYLSQEELTTRLPNPSSIDWERLDMRDPSAVAKIVEKVRPEGVFHLAAQAYAQQAWKDPVDTFESNVIGTIRFYEALRAHPPKSGILLAASASAYGEPTVLPVPEDVPLNPTNPYGVSKAAQDMLSLQYSLNFGLRILRARLFGTTGPGKTGDALNDFARQVARLERTGRPGELKVGNLDTKRDVSDIRDVVKALWLVFERGDPRAPVNVGAGQSYSIRDIAETLVRLSRVPLHIVPDPSLFRPTDEPDNRGDISRLRALGYSPSYPLERTIRDALEYWRGEP
ncbi:MAG TPA: GDP-mannose 4,6-dehydratase [Thermoplasmata archaeon]|nr:GDP-mannose 4,6-dehydratase [Thermoplasmata archaeon]